jgi:VCBS repeat-containing protein
LVRLSSTTLPVNTYLLDYGNTTGPGVSTHSLTLYRAPSGALVFGAGTVFWPWALSDNHDLEQTPTDPRVQQAMINLLADMGIQPGTLQSGLVAASASTDHTPPSSTINPLGTVAAGTIVKISGTAADVGGVVAGVEVSTDNGVSWYTAVGDTNWTYSWSPQVSGTYAIRSRAVDDSVNLQTPTAGITVTVTAPTYVSLFSSSATPAVVNTTDASAVELGVKFQTSAAGTATGVRFYKSSQDTGTHTGELWSSTGQQLATVTFNSETASGWQSATFSTPITLTPGQIYTVSYHTDVGHYSNTSNFFTSAVTSGPLTAPASGNGVFAYGSSSAFPTNTYQASNFWVDVMFNPSGGTTNQPPVAANDVGPTATQGAPVTITAASLISNDSDPNGDTLTVTAVSGATHGTVTLNVQSNPQNNTITFTPDATFIGNASFTYTVSDGHGGTASANVSLTVVAPGQTPVSLFSASSAPAGSFQDGTPLEAGVKFTTSVAGQITALKFYRSAGDTGTDILDLWSSAGANLASVAFSNTTASGWQTVALPTAITLTANTTYVASYHTTGAYVATNNFFTTAVTNGPLAASATGNGVYSYGGTNAAGVFPTSTWSAANYWADVVFIPSASGAPSNTAPTAVADVADATEKGGIANGSGGSPATGNVLTNDTDPDTGDTKTVTAVSFGTTVGTLGTAFAGAHGSIVLGANGTFTYTINESDAAVQALRLPTNTLPDTFNYTMRDTGGLTSTTTINVTIHGADDTPVLASQTASTNATVGASFSLPLPSGTFTDVDAGDTLAYTASSADGTALPAWLAFNASTRTFSGTPTAANVGAAGIKVTATDLAGAATSESFNIAVSTTPPPAPVSLFSASGTPAGSYNDGSPLELGVKFTSSVAGTITGLKFYRSAGDTGTDILNLWSATGVNLANATFTSTSASGWQTVQLATPIAINANTTYLASYHTMGAYVASGGFFSSAVTNGPLSAPSSASAAGNGVYAYGGTSSTGLFPSNTFNSANYWADVVFQPQLVG